jgi:tRNA A-37 threonylcarbamoyl transferase component Bud32
MNAKSILAKALLKQKRVWRRVNVNTHLKRWRRKRNEILSNKCVGMTIDGLDLDHIAFTALLAQLDKSRLVVIADIDHDGFYLPKHGVIGNLPCIEKSEFLPRRKFPMELVVVDGTVGVRKWYSGRSDRFLNEMESLYLLNIAGCNVPSVLELDFDDQWLITSFIPGMVLRELLASRGAKLRDRDVAKIPGFAELSPEKRRLERIAQGRMYLKDVVGQDFIDQLRVQVSKVHKAGILINDVKYGNVIIESETGRPYLVDFEMADNISGFRPGITKALLENDVEKFELHFGVS